MHLKVIKVWEVVEEEFVVLDPKHPTTREEELLHLSNRALNDLYESFD